MLLAQTDNTSFIVLLLVLGGLGHWLIRSLERLNRRQRTIYRTACALGVLSGLVAVFTFLRDTALTGPDGLLETIFLALMIGAFSALGWYFVVAVSIFSWDYVLAVPFRFVGRLRRRAREGGEYKRSHEQSSLDSRRRADQARADEERKRREVEEKQREQKRRDDARFACERFYDRHRKDVANNFPPNRLGEYFERYLGDNHPAGEVEQRAEQLRAMLQEFLDEDGNGKPRFQSIVEVREFYRQERLRIDESDMDYDLKDTLLKDLMREEELAIREFRQR